MTSQLNPSHKFAPLGSFQSYNLESEAKRASAAVATLDRKIAKWTQEIDSAAANFRNSNKHLIETLGKDQSERTTSLQSSRFRADMIASTREEREALVAEVQEILAKSTYYVEHLVPTESDLLASLMETDPLLGKKFPEYRAKLVGMPAHKLERAAQRAVGNADWAMGFAIISVVSKMPDDKQPFDPNDLAAILVESQFATQRLLQEQITNAEDAITHNNNAFVNGYENVRGLIATGLTQNAQAKAALANTTSN